MTPRRRHLLLAVLLAAVAPTASAGDYEDFFRAIELDNAGAIEDFLQQGFDPNTRSERGQVALYVALQAESPRVARLLWSHPALEVDAVNGVGETPLMMAALRSRMDGVRALLERGAAVNRTGWTPLHYAATGGDAEILRLLLARGAVVDARAPNGNTPLMMAIRYGSEAAVDALLAAGADLRLGNDAGLDAAGTARAVGRDYLLPRLQVPDAPASVPS